MLPVHKPKVKCTEQAFYRGRLDACCRPFTTAVVSAAATATVDSLLHPARWWQLPRLSEFLRLLNEDVVSIKVPVGVRHGDGAAHGSRSTRQRSRHIRRPPRHCPRRGLSGVRRRGRGGTRWRPLCGGTSSHPRRRRICWLPRRGLTRRYTHSWKSSWRQTVFSRRGAIDLGRIEEVVVGQTREGKAGGRGKLTFGEVGRGATIAAVLNLLTKNFHAREGVWEPVQTSGAGRRRGERAQRPTAPTAPPDDHATAVVEQHKEQDAARHAGLCGRQVWWCEEDRGTQRWSW